MSDHDYRKKVTEDEIADLLKQRKITGREAKLVQGYDALNPDWSRGRLNRAQKAAELERAYSTEAKSEASRKHLHDELAEASLLMIGGVKADQLDSGRFSPATRNIIKALENPSYQAGEVLEIITDLTSRLRGERELRED